MTPLAITLILLTAILTGSERTCERVFRLLSWIANRPEPPGPDRHAAASDWQEGRPFSDARTIAEAIIYRYRCGIAWRDLPEVFGPWQTAWTWHHRMATDGTWDKVLAKLTARADAAGLVDWSASPLTCRAPSAAPMIRIASVARARRSLGIGLLLSGTV
jgi:transposase